LTKNCVYLLAIALGAALLSQAQTGAPPQTSPSATPPTRVGIIAFQNAIVSTKDGQKAAAELTAKFGPKKGELEKKQSAIAQLQEQLRKGTNTMSEEAKQKLMREIDQTTKSLNRETEDAQAELDQEQNRIMQELGQRIQAVMDKYARDNGYAVILDVSSQQTPVLYAASGIDITQDIIAMYDKNAPPAASSPKPAAPPPAAAAKPAAVPPKP
jgi:outer membrane protein